MLDKILSFVADRLGVDWIIEEGAVSNSESTWEYVKYNSGKLVATVTVPLVDKTVQGTNPYYTTHTAAIPTQFNLKAAPYVFCQSRQYYISGITLSHTGTSATSIKFDCWTFQNVSRKGALVDIGIIGRWK